MLSHRLVLRLTRAAHSTLLHHKGFDIVGDIDKSSSVRLLCKQAHDGKHGWLSASAHGSSEPCSKLLRNSVGSAGG